MKNLIKKIKEKKELSAIGDEYVLEAIKKILEQNPKLAKAVTEKRTRSAQYKETVKKVRAQLRVEYGMFAEDLKEREHILKEIERTDELKKLLELNDRLLQTHKSTKERMEIYPTIYQKIFAITGVPRTILELGCGLNPASAPYMKLANLKYYASDLSEEDCRFLDRYFEAMRIDGWTIPIDLKKISKDKSLLREIPEADVCFLFKVLDTIEKRGHKKAELIITNVKAKWVAVSFATYKLGGKPMNHPERQWLEKMLERLRYEYKIIKETNEIFYVIKKK